MNGELRWRPSKDRRGWELCDGERVVNTLHWDRDAFAYLDSGGVNCGRHFDRARESAQTAARGEGAGAPQKRPIFGKRRQA